MTTHIRKSLVIPEANNKFTLSTIDEACLFGEPEPKEGEVAHITKIRNNLGENITVINEFNICQIIPRTSPKAVRQVSISFSLPKNRAVKEDLRKTAFRIDLTQEEFHKRGGVIYVDEINLVIATETAMQRNEIRHPFARPGFHDLIDNLTKRLNQKVTELGVCFLINECEASSKNYYLHFLGNIIQLGKMHYQGPDNLVMFTPKKEADGMRYESITFCIGEMKSTEVKEIVYSASYGNFTFLLSNDYELLKKEVNKRRNSIKPSMEIDEHNQLLRQLESNKDQELMEIKELHKGELEKIKADLTEKAERVSQELSEKLQSEMEKNKAMQGAVDAAQAFSKVYASSVAHENQVKTSEHRMVAAEIGVKKEEVIFTSNLVKYGLTAAATIVSIFAAKSILKP